MAEPVDDFDDEPEVVKKFLFVNRKAPYGTIYALEMLEKVLITGAYDQDVTVAFIDDGVFDIKKGQDTKSINMKNFSPTYRALAGYEIEKLFVEKESMEARGLTPEDLVVPVQVLSAEELAAVMDDQDVIISG